MFGYTVKFRFSETLFFKKIWSIDRDKISKVKIEPSFSLCDWSFIKNLNKQYKTVDNSLRLLYTVYQKEG